MTGGDDLGVVVAIPAAYVDPPTRRCRVCGALRPLNDFHRRGGGRPADQRQSQCRLCALRLARRRAARFPSERRELYLRREHGIEIADYDRLMLAQSGVCAICKRPPKVDSRWLPDRVLHVDHDHVTGKIRGLLCMQCNTHLGYIEQVGVVNFVGYAVTP